MSRYGDEGQHACRCGHVRGEHDNSTKGRCQAKSLQGTCDCDAWRRSKSIEKRRLLLREQLEQQIAPDGFLVRVAKGRLPSYCRWCKTKLVVTRRGAALCLNGDKCDVPQVVEEADAA